MKEAKQMTPINHTAGTDAPGRARKSSRTNLIDPKTFKRTLRRDSMTVLERLRQLELESVSRQDAIRMLGNCIDNLSDRLDAIELRATRALKILMEMEPKEETDDGHQ